MAYYLEDTFTEGSNTNIASHTSDSGHSWSTASWLTVIAADDEVNSTSALTTPTLSSWVPATADYDIRINGKTVGATTSHQLHVYARYTDADNWYRVRVRGDGNVYLQKMVGGVGPTDLGNAAISGFSASTYYDIEIRCDGTTIGAYIDDGQEVSVTDSDVTAKGQTGFAVYGTSARVTYLRNSFVIPGSSTKYELNIVGAVTDTTAKILVRSEEASTAIQVQYKKTGEWPGTSTATINVDADTDYTAVFTITGLTADTIYDYRVLYDTGLDADSVSTFQTFPTEDTTASFKFGFSSCHAGQLKVYYDAWDEIILDTPRFFIMGGDNLYADEDAPAPTTLAEYLNRYYTDSDEASTDGQGQWNQANLKAAWQQLPIFFAGDDHDIVNDWDQGKTGIYRFGRMAYYLYQQAVSPSSSNDSTGICEAGTTGTTVVDTGTFVNVEVGDTIYNLTQHKITFVTTRTSDDQVEVNDSGFFSVSDDFVVPQTYYSFKYGDVEFFVIDPLSYRSDITDTDNSSKTMLGSRQKTWLKAAIKDSTATWKILISGPTMATATTGADTWDWQGYQTELAELWDYWFTNDVDGITVLSGDLHYTAFWKMQGTTPSVGPFNMPWFYNLSAGPLAKTTGSAPGNPGDKIFENGGVRGYSIITIDTTIVIPTLKIDTYNDGGSPVNTATIYLNEANYPSVINPWPDIGGATYAKRKKLTYDSSAHIGSNEIDFALDVHLDSGDSDFWDNGPPVAGGGVRFGSGNASEIYEFQVESYDTSGDDGWWKVKVPVLFAASDTDIYVYFDVDSETDGSNKENTHESSFKLQMNLNQDQAEGAFDDATSNNNDGTNNGTTDALGQIDRAREFNGSSHYIAIADSDSLSFGNGSSDSAFSGDSWTNMTDATHFKIISKATDKTGGETEWFFGTGGGDAMVIVCYDDGTTDSILAVADTASTADEGTLVHWGFSYDGSGANTGFELYRKGVAVAVTRGGSGSYTAMSNTTSAVELGIVFRDESPAGWANGVIDNTSIVSGEKTVDWFIARYQSGLGTWLTVGAMEELEVSGLPVGSFSLMGLGR